MPTFFISKKLLNNSKSTTTIFASFFWLWEMVKNRVKDQRFSKGIMTDTLHDQLWNLLCPVIESHGMELIFLECLRMPSQWLVRIFLDKEGGINLDDCSIISPLAGDIMDVHEIPPGPYTLEVSSPGLDRPLFREQDFLKFKGAMIKIKTNRKIEGVKNFKGELLDYVQEEDGPYLVIRSGVKIHRIQRDAFDKANLDYEI